MCSTPSLTPTDGVAVAVVVAAVVCRVRDKRCPRVPANTRFSSPPDRRSVAAAAPNSTPEGSYSDPPTPYEASDAPRARPSPLLLGGLSRSQTLLRRGSSRKSDPLSPQSSPLPLPRRSPDLDLLLTPNEQASAPRRELYEGGAPMSQYSLNSTRKTSSDSGQSSALDRWSQRRLQRLNTEQGFREQRQGGQGVLSPPLSQDSSYSNASQYTQEPPAQPQPPQQQHQQHVQPHHQPASAYQQAQRSGPTSSTPNAALGAQSVSASSRANNNYSQQQQQQQHDAPLPPTYSPPDSAPQYHQDLPRPPLSQARSFNSQQDDPNPAASTGGAPAAKSSRSGMSNRQSVHSGLNTREGSGLAGQGGGHPGVPAFNANVVPAADSQTQGYGNIAQQQKTGDNGRGTPQPSKPMTKEDIEALIQDHAQLRKPRTTPAYSSLYEADTCDM